MRPPSLTLTLTLTFVTTQARNYGMGDKVAEAIAHTIHATNMSSQHGSHPGASSSMPVRCVDLSGNNLGRPGAERILEA